MGLGAPICSGATGSPRSAFKPRRRVVREVVGLRPTRIAIIGLAALGIAASLLVVPVKRMRNFRFNFELGLPEATEGAASSLHIRNWESMSPGYVDEWRWHWDRHDWRARHRHPDSIQVTPVSEEARECDVIRWPLVIAQHLLVLIVVGALLTWDRRRQRRVEAHIADVELGRGAA